MDIITNINQLDSDKVYTYADYLLWRIEERLELIKGKVFKMSPAPSRQHQETLRRVNRYFDNYFLETSCSVFFAPFDVRLPKNSKENEQIYTVVQPDLCVVCDADKLDDKGCIGAPDLVVEILSPGNSKKELKTKFSLYEESGVKEYWIIHPEEEVIFIYVLKDGKYQSLPPLVDDFASSSIFPNLRVHTNDIFSNK